MACWKVKGKGWRYQFQYEGKEYSGTQDPETGTWFQTKARAKAAEAERKKEVTGKKPEKEIGLTFGDLANEYLEYAERRFAEKTWKYKAGVYRSFMNHAGDLPIEKITIPTIESYLRTRHSNINYNRHRKDLCALFSWAWKRRMLPENPCFFLEKMPEPKFIRPTPSPEEMHRLLLAAGEHRPFILVLYHTLARLDEILRLRWEDVNFEAREVRLWTRKRKDGAWDFDALPMNQVLYDTLWNLWEKRSQEDWVFFNPMTATRFYSRRKIMRSICAQAGIRHFGFHSIRHYVASLLRDRKKFSIAKISRLLRHQEQKTTEQYLHLVDPDLRQVLVSLEDFS
jgi:integrase